MICTIRPYQPISAENLANQSTLPLVQFFNLLFHRWLEAIHCAFYYVNLSNMCSKKVFHSITLSNVGFFITSQSDRIYRPIFDVVTT